MSVSLPERTEEVDECLTKCLEQTCQALSAAGLASDAEIAKLSMRYDQARDKGEPVDILETLARIQGAEEERIGIEVAALSHGVASVISPSPPLIPFAGKLIAPSAFYEAYTHLHGLARALLAPVIFAEDTDAIGTGALNPIAARIMAARVLDGVNRRFAIRPFLTAVRLDYESWTFLNRKHFGL